MKKSQQIREPLMPDSKIENYNDGENVRKINQQGKMHFYNHSKSMWTH